MASTVVKRNGAWLSASVGGELMMMSADTGNYVTVSRVGGRIWELIEQPRTIDEICELLLGEFEVAAETCRADVQRFIAEMIENRAIVLEDARTA